MINIFIIIGIVALAFTLLAFIKKKFGTKPVLLIAKVFAITLFVLGVFRGFLNDSFIWVINGGNYGGTYYQVSDVLQSLLRWGMFLSFMVYPCAVFFKTRTIKNFAVYFCLPVAILSLIFYQDFLTYFTTNSGRAIMTSDWFRHFEFSFELILIILVPLVIRFLIGHKFDVKNKKEWLYFFGLLPCTLILVVPVCVPQSLFGFTNMFMIPFSIQNFLWVIIIFSLLTILYFAFRFKDYETRYMICVFFGLYLFMHYNSIYSMDLIMSRLPFQLCNLGSFLVLIALIVKKQSFFDFILIANVAGAMIAFCVPDIDEGMLSYWNMHFYIEHTWVFIVPLLMVSLRIFERPKLSAIKHFFVGFTIYFLFCAVSGVICNAFLYVPNDPFFNKVNYFYLFDTTVLSALPFLGFTLSVSIVVNGYVFYPLYMLLIYGLYSIFCMAFFYVLSTLCKVGDNHFNLRKIKVDMYNEEGRYKKRIPQTRYSD